jgi:hypothetical protein
MVRLKRIGLTGGLLACAWCTTPALAQDSNTVIGPPQLRDFQLEPQNRIVTQPQPAPTQQAPVVVAPPPPVTTPSRTAPTRQSPAPMTTRPAPTTARPVPVQTAPAGPGLAPTGPAPTVSPPPTTLEPAPSDTSPPLTSEAAPAREMPDADDGGSFWLYAVPLALLALLGTVILNRRRRRAEDEPVALAAPAAAASPPKPRADPIERPWIELELKTERASFTETEAGVHFVLAIRNAGKSPARNLRVDVKMFNAGQEQDKEIGAFFRTAGRQSTRLNLPGVAPGESGEIRGEVGLKREEIRALQLNDRTLFIPVIAVNALYDCGDGRTGQSSKSYVIGRELQESGEKMGAFRVDQGPRIWRTVGQRQHKLARRV